MPLRKLAPGERYSPEEINKICAVTFERLFGEWFNAPEFIKTAYRDTTRDIAHSGSGSSPFELGVLDTLARLTGEPVPVEPVLVEQEGEAHEEVSVEAVADVSSEADPEVASGEAVFGLAE